MFGKKAKPETPKRINNKFYTNLNLVSDLIALTIGHYIIYFTNQIPIKNIADFVLPGFLITHPLISLHFIILVLWVFNLYLAGNYTLTAYKSGIQIFGPTLATSFFTTLIIFYFLLGFTSPIINKNYLELSFNYFIIQFAIIIAFRLFIMHLHQYRIKKGKIGYHGILIGCNNNAMNIINNYEKNRPKSSYRYIGFVSTQKDNIDKISRITPHLGTIDDLPTIIEKYSFDDAVLTISNDQPTKLNSIITTLRQCNCQIKLYTQAATFISGTAQKQKLENYPFYVIHSNDIPVWQKIIKVVNDYGFAILFFILSLPVSIFICIGIKLTTKGPVLYKQERLGKNKKPFTIYKFRTMHLDAEKDGHQLSCTDDPRITAFGKCLRKWHLDEIPQFINILKGDMSLVGPRPERKFYIDQIQQRAPHYDIIFSVKPGITSWGMVKFGYAENVDEMLERLTYDLQYMENRTLTTDYKIFLYTFKSIILGDGK